MATPTTTDEARYYDALILAGGEGRRMGGLDKGLQAWLGAPLYRHVLARLQAQALAPAHILISANRNAAVYGTAGHPVLPDLRPDHQGPLAGIEAGLLAAQSDWLLCVACDMPQLPADLAKRLFAAIPMNGLASYATTDEGPQPVCCLLHRDVLGSLQAALDANQGGVKRWLDTLSAGTAQFDDARAFSNYNTQAALQDPSNLP